MTDKKMEKEVGSTMDGIKRLSTDPVLKSVVKNCSLTGEIILGSGGKLESIFSVSCSPEQTAKVLDGMEKTPMAQEFGNSLASLGIEKGRCGVKATGSTNGELSIRAICPAP